MGQWGWFDDQNDSTADAWEDLVNRYLSKGTKIKSSKAVAISIRKHPQRWYEALILEVVHVVGDKTYRGNEAKKVAVGLIVQTVRLMTAKVCEVEDYFIGGLYPRIKRITSEGRQSDKEQLQAFPKHLPDDFPKELRDYAREANKLPALESGNEKLERAMRVQARLFK